MMITYGNTRIEKKTATGWVVLVSPLRELASGDTFRVARGDGTPITSAFSGATEFVVGKPAFTFLPRGVIDHVGEMDVLAAMHVLIKVKDSPSVGVLVGSME